MRLLFYTVLTMSLSPIWPLGQNPLPGDPYVIINKQTNELAFIDQGKIQKVYPASTGKTADLTPEGEFTIMIKAKDPYYRRKNIEGGAKNNPLGRRWIGFDARGTDGRTYGIHGTSDETSIGKFITAGCVRLHNQDVELLFDQLPIGTKVWITTSSDSFETLAKDKQAIR